MKWLEVREREERVKREENKDKNTRRDSLRDGYQQEERRRKEREERKGDKSEKEWSEEREGRKSENGGERW